MPDLAHPLRLATGSHDADSGKGCAMNVISWENGDSTITDFPTCSDPMLARIVQRVNDTICTHRDGDLLCSACSQAVLELGHRTVGTSAHGLSELDLCRVWVRVAAHLARSVQHLNTDPRVEAAIAAAERWAGDPSEVNANEARKARAYAADAADAAYAAAYAAYAAYAAAYAAYAADAAHDAADADAAAAYAYAAHAAAAASRLAKAHMAIDKFIELTAVTPTPLPIAFDEAVARMLAPVAP